MNISENNVFQANKNMESKKSLIDFANYYKKTRRLMEQSK